METGIKLRSITISLLIHAAIFLLLFFLVMHTPNPPFPEAGGGGGMLVNIGYIDMATGEVQPMSELTSSQPQPEVVQQQPAVQPDEQLLSQEEENTAVVETKDKKTETVKPIVKPKETAVTPKVTPKPVEKTADPRALYKGKSTNSTSQGTAKTGQGDQGSKEGDPMSNYYGKNGSGNGSGGGDGGGNGGGSGPGTGPGSGPGISYNLSGRSPLKRIKPEDTSQEEGVVVVAITVDKDGHVVNANPGVQGSTTTSTLLYNKAKQAALKWEFNKSTEGFETQKGTITFVFKNK